MLLEHGARPPPSCEPTEHIYHSGIPDSPHFPYLENKRICTESCVFADPLTYACALGDEAVVWLLLSKGAHSGLFEMRHPDREGVWIPFCAAVENEHFQLAWRLLQLAGPERRWAAERHLRQRMMGGRGEGWLAVQALVRFALEAERLRGGAGGPLGGAGYVLGTAYARIIENTPNNSAGADGFEGGTAPTPGMGLHSPPEHVPGESESSPEQMQPLNNGISCSQLTPNNLGPDASYALTSHPEAQSPSNEFNNAEPNSFNTPLDDLSIALIFNNAGTPPTPDNIVPLGAVDTDLPEPLPGMSPQLASPNQSQDPFCNAANIDWVSSLPEDGFMYDLPDFLSDLYMALGDLNEGEGAQKQSSNPSEGVPSAADASQYENGVVGSPFETGRALSPSDTAELTFPSSSPHEGLWGQLMGISAPQVTSENRALAQEAYLNLWASRQLGMGPSTNRTPSNSPKNSGPYSSNTSPFNTPASPHPSNTEVMSSSPPTRMSTPLFNPKLSAELQREYTDLENYVNSPPDPGLRNYPQHMYANNGTIANHFNGAIANHSNSPEFEPFSQAVLEAVLNRPPMQTWTRESV